MSVKTFIIRASVAGTDVINLAFHRWLGFEPFWWLGLAICAACLAMILQTLILLPKDHSKFNIVATVTIAVALIIISTGANYLKVPLHALGPAATSRCQA